MTLDKVFTLEDAIDEALLATGFGKTPEVVRWILLHRRGVVDEISETLTAEALGARVRDYRKKRDAREDHDSSHQICLDLGLPDMELDTEISIPEDLDNVPYGPCAWVEADDATLDDISRHLALLRAQRAALDEQVNNWELVLQRGMQITGGRTNISLREIRILAQDQ